MRSLITQSSHRTSSAFLTTHHKKQSYSRTYSHAHTDYGVHTFTQKDLGSTLYGQMRQSFDAKETLPHDVVMGFTQSVKSWAVQNGVTHYTHWFQPLTGLEAEKHDAFLNPVVWQACSGSKVEEKFTVDDLCLAQPDASSFPSGGIRETHCARGYTVWDPQTPIWIKEVGGVKTMMIPSVFYSWTGEALDRKIPSIRAQLALEKAINRMLDGIDTKGHSEVHINCGAEQEFFLVPKDLAEQRLDLMTTGRTMQGSFPPKGQELSDHYFGAFPGQALTCIADFEVRAWKLGIPVKTRHQEVAPNQFEVAPVYGPSSVSADQNTMLMSLLRDTANDHGFVCLLHEKPFKGVNGSGKHNNISFGTDLNPNFLNPGDDPIHNDLFLLSLTAFVKGLDMHQDILRHSVSGASNDLRLGGHEAPPAIMSMFLGDYINNIVEEIITGNSKKLKAASQLDLPYLPNVKFDPTDRNRTSPFAFNGANFEVRAAGSSHLVSKSNVAIYTIVAHAMESITDEILEERTSGKTVEEAIERVVRRNLEQHQRIVFQGNNYSNEWKEEAKDRGLLNLESTVDALNYFNNDQNRSVFSKMGVMNEREFSSIVSVDYDDYSMNVNIEARSLMEIAQRYVIPFASREITQLSGVVNNTKSPGFQTRMEKLSTRCDKAMESLDQLEGLCDKLIEMEGEAKANFSQDKIRPTMDHLRSSLDNIESLCYAKEWPLPTYRQILFKRS